MHCARRGASRKTSRGEWPGDICCCPEHFTTTDTPSCIQYATLPLLLASLASLSQAQPSGEAQPPFPPSPRAHPTHPLRMLMRQPSSRPRSLASSVATTRSSQRPHLPRRSQDPRAALLESAPIGEVVSAIMGDIVKTGYVVHPPLVGTVTLNAPGGVTPDQAVYLLEAALVATAWRWRATHGASTT